jgi:hypothetical protein
MRAEGLLLALLPLYAVAVMPLSGGAGGYALPRQPQLVFVTVGKATPPYTPEQYTLRPRPRESVGKCSRLDVSVWIVSGM